MMRYVPDTSVLIDGRISQLVMDGTVSGDLVIDLSVIAELEHQANQGRETGFAGLRELQSLVKLASKKKINVEYVGELPSMEDIELRRVDSIIRERARVENATLITSDIVQSEAAKAVGVNVLYIEKTEKKRKKPRFTDFFDDETTSVHIKAGCKIIAKKGRPGKQEVVELTKTNVNHRYVEEIGREIVEISKSTRNAFIEIDRKGATVIQYKNYRITIARPPFSDGLEITIVRPIKKTRLEDWNIDEKLLERLERRAEGVLIAGPPGHGKSTLASALAEFYRERGKIVKTMESPRDLQVSDEITQYTALEGDFEKTADILLLVRPDYTIYDEVRKTRDFQIYADLRLAGVGMIGVVHANKAVDAIHRMIGRVDFGLIPQVVDTVILVRDAEIKEVYSLEFAVKVPAGIRDAELARPVVEVKDFYTGEPLYEIYTYGEQTILASVKEVKKVNRRKGRIEKMLEKYFSGKIEVGRRNVVVHATKGELKRVNPKTLKRLEKRIKRRIDIELVG